MFLALSVAVSVVHGARVYVGCPCLDWSDDMIASVTNHSSRGSVVVTSNLGILNTSITRMELFAMARLEVGEVLTHTDAPFILVTACSDSVFGVAFTNRQVGMDCATARISEVIECNVGDHVEHVYALLSDLDSWTKDGVCTVWLPEPVAAAVFWGTLLLMVRVVSGQCFHR